MISMAAAAAVGQTSPSSSASESNPPDAKPAQSSPRKVDRAAAYYHYTLAHMYEEMVTAYGRSDLANKAMEEYRLAIEADPSSEFLTSGLAELYVKTGRIGDAVREAQDIIKRDPKNLEAHKLLGRIYLRSLGDMPGGTGSDNVLKLAIDQYEQIVKLDPDSVDDHLLLGRLYRLNNDLQKAEGELKTAVKLDPSSEEAVTTLAMLYTDEGDTAHALQSSEFRCPTPPAPPSSTPLWARPTSSARITRTPSTPTATPSFSIATISTPFAAWLRT